MPFEILPCERAYFQYISFVKLCNKKDVDMVQLLTVKYGVATLPLSVFYTKNTHSQIVRWCFAKENTPIEKAIERLSVFKIENL